jgi:hypothetical protein
LLNATRIKLKDVIVENFKCVLWEGKGERRAMESDKDEA